MVDHGGKVRAAAARWDIPVADWLDLSTGIAPRAYPLPALSPEHWRRLPEDDDGLEAAARSYYGTQRLLVLPGSQAAIQALPRLLPMETVAVLTPSYGEYAANWQTRVAGLRSFAADGLDEAADHDQVVIVCNPNNPTGQRFSRKRLLDAASRLQKRGGYLIVDEAFADAEPEPADSLTDIAGSPEARNVIVLRSLGKFFGLAGARVGFAIAAPEILAKLSNAIGPWAVSHPAREVARIALSDSAWQAAQRNYLKASRRRLAALLCETGFERATGTALFQYVVTPAAGAIAEILAAKGILVRHFESPAALRIGLPATESEWTRLATALDDIPRSHKSP